MRPTKKPLVVGVAGIMGAGKSVVARVFEELGAARIDADQMGKEMLKEPAMKSAVVGAFGRGVAGERGEIDTARLGEAAFASPESAANLDRLTREPLIARIRARIEDLRAARDVIVVDAALLPEWGAGAWLDVLLVVDCDEEQAAERLAASSRFKPSEIRSRMNHQYDRARKAAAADIVIPNYGSLEDLKARAQAIFRTLRGIGSDGEAGRKE